VCVCACVCVCVCVRVCCHPITIFAVAQGFISRASETEVPNISVSFVKASYTNRYLLQIYHSSVGSQRLLFVAIPKRVLSLTHQVSFVKVPHKNRSLFQTYSSLGSRSLLFVAIKKWCFCCEMSFITCLRDRGL